jgi:hypothetical protein
VVLKQVASDVGGKDCPENATGLAGGFGDGAGGICRDYNKVRLLVMM